MKLQVLVLIALLFSTAVAQSTDSLSVSNFNSLPFTLLSEPAFLPTDRYEPKYFCVLSGAPLDLPPQSGQRSFQMLQGMLGISWDKKEQQYVVKQLKLFQSQSQEGTLKARSTKRLFLLPEQPGSDDWSTLHIESDAKAIDLSLIHISEPTRPY